MAAKILQFPGGKRRPDPPAVAAPIPALAERNRLVEEHLDMVQPIARSIARRLPPSFDVDDLIQFGFMGLMDAAERYDASTNVPFSAFARPRVSGAILDGIRRRNWRDATLPGIGEMPFADERTPSPDRLVEEREQRERIDAALEQLLPREREIIVRFYRHEEHLGEVAAHFRIHPSRASQIHTSALLKLRRILGDAEDIRIVEFIRMAA